MCEEENLQDPGRVLKHMRVCLSTDTLTGAGHGHSVSGRGERVGKDAAGLAGWAPTSQPPQPPWRELFLRSGGSDALFCFGSMTTDQSGRTSTGGHIGL